VAEVVVVDLFIIQAIQSHPAVQYQSQLVVVDMAATIQTILLLTDNKDKIQYLEISLRLVVDMAVAGVETLVVLVEVVVEVHLM
jgi:hypothetical protein